MSDERGGGLDEGVIVVAEGIVGNNMSMGTAEFLL